MNKNKKKKNYTIYDLGRGKIRGKGRLHIHVVLWLLSAKLWNH